MNAVKTGDLLVWTKDQQSFKSNLFLKVVRFFTQSEFAHVGIAYWVGDRLCVIEATIPEVRIYPLSNKDEFYHIAMDADVDLETEDWLLDKVGLPYSFMDCLRAYFGYVSSNNQSYQCAELCNEFYRKVGIELGTVYTPSKLVYSAISLLDTKITLVNPE